MGRICNFGLHCFLHRSLVHLHHSFVPHLVSFHHHVYDRCLLYCLHLRSCSLQRCLQSGSSGLRWSSFPCGDLVLLLHIHLSCLNLPGPILPTRHHLAKNMKTFFEKSIGTSGAAAALRNIAGGALLLGNRAALLLLGCAAFLLHHL